ncbi:MAG: DUF6879 family protein [Sciscionella sp.]
MSCTKCANDDAGTWLGVEHVTDQAEVMRACAWRDAAWRHAIQWRDYLYTRPELVDRLPTR